MKLSSLIHAIGISRSVSGPRKSHYRSIIRSTLSSTILPLAPEDRYEVILQHGTRLEVTPQVEGRPANLENLFAVWSDGRSWRQDVERVPAGEGLLRFPANNVMFGLCKVVIPMIVTGMK